MREDSIFAPVLQMRTLRHRRDEDLLTLPQPGVNKQVLPMFNLSLLTCHGSDSDYRILPFGFTLGWVGPLRISSRTKRVWRIVERCLILQNWSINRQQKTSNLHCRSQQLARLAKTIPETEWLKYRNLSSHNSGYPRSRCWQGWFLLRPLSSACRWSFLCVFIWSSLCKCLCPNFRFLKGH